MEKLNAKTTAIITSNMLYQLDKTVHRTKTLYTCFHYQNNGTIDVFYPLTALTVWSYYNRDDDFMI